MSLKYKIAYNTLVQFIGRFATSLIGFITTLILARFLGAAEYGVYSKIYTLVAFFYLFVDFGLNAVYVRRYQNNLSKLNQVFSLRTIFFLVSLVLIGLFLLFSGNLIFTGQQKLWVLLFAPTILLFGYYTTLNIVFQLKLRYDLSVLSAIIGGLAGLVLLIPAIKYGLVYAILSLVIGYLITVLSALFLANRLNPLSFKQLVFGKQDFFWEALPLGIMLFLNTMYTRADVFVIAAFQGDAAVGIYSLAYKFFEFPLAFAAFFANSVFPHYVKAFGNNQAYFWKIFKKATLYLILASLVFTLCGFIIAPFLKLIKADYILSVKPLQILVLSYPVFFATSALSWLVFILKKEKALIAVYGLSFAVNIVANILLVPQYSYLASSWLTVIGEILVLVMLAGVLFEKKHPRV